MALYRTPEEHAANPPDTWTIHKVGHRRWALRDAQGSTIDTYVTMRDADNARRRGFYVDLYDRERRWFAGEPVAGWKPYAPSS